MRAVRAYHTLSLGYILARYINEKNHKFTNPSAEFDENAPVTKEEEDEEEEQAEANNTNNNISSGLGSTAIVVTTHGAGGEDRELKDLEAEFASWQEKVGPDFKALEASLRGIERFALRLHTEVEPYYSIFYLTEQQRLEGLGLEAQASSAQGEEWDVDRIEKEKEEVGCPYLHLHFRFIFPNTISLN